LGHDVFGTYLTRDELARRGPSSDSIHWIQLDLQDSVEVNRVVEEVRADSILHLAAQAYAKRAWEDPADTFRTNVIGTISLFEALRRNPPREGILLTSSASAYGVPEKLPMREDIPLRPTNPYGVSKACQDMISFQYSMNYGLRIVRARLFGTTGPGKMGDALNDFAQQVANLERAGKPGVLKVGNLSVRRDLIDVRDAVRALWLLFEKGTSSRPVNVGSGRAYSIGWIAETLAKVSSVTVNIQKDASLFRPTDEPETRADISRLTELGYTPDVPIERTITDSLEYWRQG
jgi:nucleoside-diphosphate-sugar epimerase